MGGKASTRGRSRRSRRRRCSGREVALPDVHPVLAAGLELVAPGERLAVQPAAGGELPLRLGREPRRRPRRSRPAASSQETWTTGWSSSVRRSTSAGPRDAASRRLRPSPPRGLRDASGGREVVRQQAGEDERPAEPLGVGDVARLLDEAARTPRSRRAWRRSRRRRPRPPSPGPRRPRGMPSDPRCPSRTRRRRVARGSRRRSRPLAIAARGRVAAGPAARRRAAGSRHATAAPSRPAGAPRARSGGRRPRRPRRCRSAPTRSSPVKRLVSGV